jgi:hypothetical protein
MVGDPEKLLVTVMSDLLAAENFPLDENNLLV